jgi:hypothetical protein
MLSKQACPFLAAGGQPDFYLAYWIGISLQGFLPGMASAGLMMDGDPPVQCAGLLTLIREFFSLDCVDTGDLQEVISAAIYKEFTFTLPTPLVERLRPDLAWQIIWLGLDGPSLVANEVDLHFSLLHNLLGVLANQHHLRVALHLPACFPDTSRC